MNIFLLGVDLVNISALKSNMSYDELLEKRILMVLGMADTSINLPGEQESNDATGYFRLIKKSNIVFDKLFKCIGLSSCNVFDDMGNFRSLSCFDDTIYLYNGIN